MVTKIAVAVVLVAFLAVPSASFAASKTKTKASSRADVTKCEGGGCTAVNPDRDPDTSLRSQHYRSTHKKHKIQN
jgi:hypothetical protein